MKVGDLVKRKNGNGKFGLFAERAPNGDIVSSIQKNLIDVINESR